MKKNLLTTLFFLLSILFISCSDQETTRHFDQPHIGKWSGTDLAGTKATIVFSESGTGTIEFNNDLYKFMYVIDYSRQPIWLDLIYARENKPFRAKFILKFIDKNKLKWRTFFNDKRPSEFLPDDSKNTMVLTRDNPVRET